VLGPARDRIWQVRPQSSIGASSISFRSLQFADLPQMHRWLNTDFVARWYGDRPSAQSIASNYAPKIRGEVPTRPFIIEQAGQPIGYIQAYRLSDWPDYRASVGIDEDAAAIDLFIGESAYAHRGLGSAIIKKFTREIVFAQMNVRTCVIGPDENNRTAIRCYEKAGFKFLKKVHVPGEAAPEHVMRIELGDLYGDEL